MTIVDRLLFFWVAHLLCGGWFRNLSEVFSYSSSCHTSKIVPTPPHPPHPITAHHTPTLPHSIHPMYPHHHNHPTPPTPTPYPFTPNRPRQKLKYPNYPNPHHTLPCPAQPKIPSHPTPIQSQPSNLRHYPTYDTTTLLYPTLPYPTVPYQTQPPSHPNPAPVQPQTNLSHPQPIPSQPPPIQHHPSQPKISQPQPECRKAIVPYWHCFCRFISSLCVICMLYVCFRETTTLTFYTKEQKRWKVLDTGAAIAPYIQISLQ